MNARALEISPARVAPAALALLLVPIALFIANAPLHLPFIAALGVIIFAAALVSAEAGFVILIASMLLSPEIPLGAAGSGGIDTSRSVVLRTEDLLLLLIGFAWLARMAIHKDLGALRRTRLNGAIAAFGACCLLSTLLGIGAARVRPLAGLCYVAKYLEYFVLYFMTVNYVRTPEALRRLLVALLATAGAITLYAWWQIPQGVRPSAPFEGAPGEPNTLGGYLVLIFAVATALWQVLPPSPLRRGSGILSLAILPPLVATLSRSSWLGFAGAFVVLLLLVPRKAPLFACGALGLALLLLAMPDRMHRRLSETFTPEGQDSVRVGRLGFDPSASARLQSWGSALKGWRDHPVVGWGLTGYGFLDAMYFRVLVETGALGFAAFVGLLVACGLVFWRARGTLDDPLQRGLATGMLAGFAGLLLHAVGTNTFLLIRIMEPYWLLTGLVVAALAQKEAL